MICDEPDSDDGGKRMKYSDGLSAKSKDDGIHKCLLIAVTPGSAEDRGVLKLYVEICGILPGEFFLCSDMKILNEGLGLMNHAAR